MSHRHLHTLSSMQRTGMATSGTDKFSSVVLFKSYLYQSILSYSIGISRIMSIVSILVCFMTIYFGLAFLR